MTSQDRRDLADELEAMANFAGVVTMRDPKMQPAQDRKARILRDAATALRASEVTEAQVDAAIAAADAEAKTFITDDAFAAKFGISSVAGLLCRVMRPALEAAALTAALGPAEEGKE